MNDKMTLSIMYNSTYISKNIVLVCYSYDFISIDIFIKNCQQGTVEWSKSTSKVERRLLYNVVTRKLGTFTAKGRKTKIKNYKIIYHYINL